MRAFLIGIAAFLLWSGGSGYYYICQVKCLCAGEKTGSEALEVTDAGNTVEDVEPEESEEVPDIELEEASESPIETAESDLPTTEEEIPVEEPEAEEIEASEEPAEMAQPVPQGETHSILFSYAKPIMHHGDKSEAFLNGVVSSLNADPSLKVYITGYTDDTAARENNLKLGKRRAEAVADLLREKGVSDAQMVLESKGEANPVATNNTPAGRRKNRRVEIFIGQ